MFFTSQTLFNRFNFLYYLFISRNCIYFYFRFNEVESKGRRRLAAEAILAICLSYQSDHFHREISQFHPFALRHFPPSIKE